MRLLFASRSSTSGYICIIGYRVDADDQKKQMAGLKDKALSAAEQFYALAA